MIRNSCNRMERYLFVKNACNLKLGILFGALVCLTGCEDNSDIPFYHKIHDSYQIICPDPPIEIMSSQDEEIKKKGIACLNYYNILKVSESLYYMYYESYMGRDDASASIVRLAYSHDGFHWKNSLPDKPDEDNVIIPSYYYLAGMSVMMVPDEQYPFRLFGLMPVEGIYGIYMFKSQDGIHFERPKEVLTGFFDTQIVGLVSGNGIKLYTRTRKNRGTNRKIGVAYVDLEGNVVTSPMVLRDNYVYNSGASILNEKYDLLFPTYFNDSGGDDKAYVKALIASGYDSREIECNIGDWVGKDEPWIIVSPGIIKIDGEDYVSYYTNTWSHNKAVPEDGVTKYKLIKILTLRNN